MERTIEHERTTTSAVKQLRNDLKDEKIDHEDKVCGVFLSCVCAVCVVCGSCLPSQSHLHMH